MSQSGQEAKFSVAFDGNVKDFSDEAATSVEELHAAIDGATGSLKEISGSMRNLKGKGDDVVKMKNELKAKADAVRDSISRQELALLKAGTSYTKITNDAKKLAQQQVEAKKKNDEATAKEKDRLNALTSAVQKGGGPVASLRARFSELKEMLTGAGGGMAIAALAMTGLIAAGAKLGSMLISSGISLAKFALESANALRAMGLQREAALGNAESAKNLGDQIEVLAMKVPLSREALNDLAVTLSKTRLSGQQIVDTLNLVGTASAAMGDEVGGRLKDIVTRSQQTQRMFISPQELFGTGLEFKDVAAELSKSMHVGMADAQKALFEGRVKLDDGAKALKAAVEKRFSGINAKKLLDLNMIAQKLHERFVGLTAGINLEPLLKGLDEIAKMFDDSTMTGAALKQIITLVGNDLGKAVGGSTPTVKTFFKSLVIAMLETVIAGYKVRNALRDAFSDNKTVASLITTKDALLIASLSLRAMVAGIEVSVAGLVVLSAAAYSVVRPFLKIIEVVELAYDKFKTTNWKSLGFDIVDGLTMGINSKLSGLENTVRGMGKSAAGWIRDELGINSPSKVFKELGVGIPEGMSLGIETGTPDVQSATEAMAPSPPAPASLASGGAGGAGGGSVTVNVSIVVQAGGGKGEDVAAALSTPSFRAQLGYELERVCKQLGIAPTLAGAT